MTRNQEIAQEILAQLGGGRFKAMTGAKDFVAIENGLQMKIGRGAKKSISIVRIVLNDRDTYDVEFGKVSRKKDKQLGISIPTYVKVAEHDGLYFDMLQDTFTEVTGFDTSLGF